MQLLFARSPALRAPFPPCAASQFQVLIGPSFSMDVDAVKANTAAKETTNTTDPKFIDQV